MSKEWRCPSCHSLVPSSTPFICKICGFKEKSEPVVVKKPAPVVGVSEADGT